ncbi:MAG: LytR/AlgR family response regulator transcription factor [Acidobacteriota bacterium]
MEKILVIEDNSSVCNNIKQLLEKAGYETFTAENGSEGVRLAQEMLPDAVICDIMMPVMDGYEVLKQLSCTKATASIPFLFLTAKVEMADLRHGMELGADDYLVKPFTAGELLRAIKTRLEKRKNLILDKNEIPREQVKESAMNTSVIVTGNPPEVLKIADIVFIQASEGYTFLYMAEGKKVLARRLLKKWQDILPEDQFLRIHNSTIINLNYLEKVEKWFNSSLRVHLRKAEEPLEVSKRYAPGVKQYLKMK